MNAWGSIRIFEDQYGYFPRGQTTNTNFLLLLDMQNEHIAKQYVIIHVTVRLPFIW